MFSLRFMWRMLASMLPIEDVALSSKNIFATASLFTASVADRYCASLNRWYSMLEDDTSLSPDTIRAASCILDISIEYTATLAPCIAALVAMFIASDVLPCELSAAITMRSPCCKPLLTLPHSSPRAVFSFSEDAVPSVLWSSFVSFRKINIDLS
jgi:hypothetical protein